VKSFVVETPGGQSLRVIQLLRNKTNSLNVNIAWDKKDKIEFSITKNEPSEDLLRKIRLACPTASIEESENGNGFAKLAELPIGTWIEGRIVTCPNKNCVTVQPKEPTKPRFKIVSLTPVTLQCYYCSRYIGQDAVFEQLTT
jgi:aspartate carbamoyltransferase regulatory subunit